MVGIVIECRLGNQLFQYAFIRGLSKKINTPFFINDTFEKFTAADYFYLEGYNPLKNFINRVYFKLTSGSISKSLQSVAVDDYSDPIISQATNEIIYRGYFQSALFFDSIAGNISSHIRIKEKFQQQFSAKYKDTFAGNKIIAVHIRRGDYLNLNDWWQQNLGSNDLTLPANYYLQGIEQVTGHQNCRIIFVSDDMDFARATFGHIKNAEFASNDMIIDFQILMNADACIISNSSFSWWAAYLNNNKNKQIICPKYWLGFKIKKEYPAHIVPDNWIQVTI